ncbi:MAG TPA: 2Fe-2S iron-sulfur cluster-binding protein [Cyclobacteriaceae bacterium]|nr:2Fe-2S iron-sulfur cluster-binding protein [Cyclobacteriaceae bacterium]
MPKIIISNLQNKTIEVKADGSTILQHIQEAYLDWMHTCGGKGRCTTCRAKILSGWAALSELSAAEEKFKSKGLLKEDERLCCQAVLREDILIEVPVDCQLPHVSYSASRVKS